VKMRYAISFVAFGLIAACAVSYIASLGVRVGPPDDRINVSMRVPDVNGLVVDSNVLLRGVPVGKVTGIDTAVQNATIHFYIDKQYPIPVDSVVKLENLSALGESYIGFMPRSSQGPLYHDGQQVLTQDIEQPASISELATSMARVLKQLDPGHLNRLVHEADRAFPSPATVLPNLMRASMLLRSTVKSMHGRGSEVLANFQTLLQNAGFVGPDLATVAPLLADVASAMSGLFGGLFRAASFVGAPESVRNIGRLMARIQKFLDDRAPDLKVFAEAFMPNIKGIAAAAMNVDTGQILSNMLDAVPEDGTITLRVTTPRP
jgi:phospholipid/cholesterol/gamma-HCH transport system substrate-binding protein